MFTKYLLIKIFVAIMRNHLEKQLTKQTLCQLGFKINQGANKLEVVIIDRKSEKKTGFFERLFHFFK